MYWYQVRYQAQVLYLPPTVHPGTSTNIPWYSIYTSISVNSTSRKVSCDKFSFPGFPLHFQKLAHEAQYGISCNKNRLGACPRVYWWSWSTNSRSTISNVTNGDEIYLKNDSWWSGKSLLFFFALLSSDFSFAHSLIQCLSLISHSTLTPLSLSLSHSLSHSLSLSL